MRLFVAVVLTTLAAVPAVAQDAPPEAADGLTLAEAVALAQRRSPDIRRAASQTDAAALAVRGARAGRLPSLGLTVTPAQQYGLSFDQTTGQLVSQTVETMNVGLGGDLRLYDGRRTRYAVEQARLEQDAAAATAERTGQTVALDVAQRFLQVLLDRELIGVQRASLAAAWQQREQVAILVDAGARPRGDVVAQDAVVAERQSALVAADGALRRSQALLALAVGLDPFAPPAFVGPDLAAIEASGLLDDRPRDGAALLAAARLRRADVRSQALRVEASQAAARAARATSRPTLDLGASFGTGYSSLQQRIADPDAPVPEVPVTLSDGTPVLVGGSPFTIPGGSPDFERTPVFNQFGDNRSGRIGLTLSVPILDRAARTRAVAEAQLRTLDLLAEADALDRQLATEVVSAAIDAETATAQLAAAEVQLGAAEAALAVERDRYDAGAGTLYAIAEAEARRTEARSGRAQAAYGLVFRQALLALATGDPDALTSLLD